MMEEFLQTAGLIVATIMGISAVIALLLLIIVVFQARRINVPPGAGFAETLLHTPLTVVLFLDFLDLALDILAAPIAWMVLDRIGLRALRGVAAVEALIPMTQVVPTMTLSWLGVRLLGRDAVVGTEKYAKYTISDPQ
jgi:hypothetical protein